MLWYYTSQINTENKETQLWLKRSKIMIEINMIYDSLIHNYLYGPISRV